jgi:hypothetical protein
MTKLPLATVALCLCSALAFACDKDGKPAKPIQNLQDTMNKPAKVNTAPGSSAMPKPVNQASSAVAEPGKVNTSSDPAQKK